MHGLSWLQKLECRGGTIFVLAVLSTLVVTFIGLASMINPAAVFDNGGRQVFWLSLAAQLIGGLTTALSGTKRETKKETEPEK